MICPVVVANEMSGLTVRGVKFHRERRRADGGILCPGSGAGNENSGSDTSSNQRTDLVDAGSRDHRHIGSQYEAMEATV
jgi:hypothetical protein